MAKTNTETLNDAAKIVNFLKVFERSVEILKTAAAIETEIGRLNRNKQDAEKALAEVYTRIDEKNVELQQTIDSMTGDAQSQSTKAQERLGKVLRHCEEQINTARAKYVKDKAKLSAEIGDLEGHRAQLVKACEKLKAQQMELADRSSGQRALEVAINKGVNGTTAAMQTQETLTKLQRERKDDMDKAIAKFQKDKKKLTEDVGNLGGQRAQLLKSVEKLKAEQVELENRVAEAQSALTAKTAEVEAVETTDEPAENHRPLLKLKEQMAEAREQYAKEKKKIDRELGDLKAQKEQLAKAVQKLKGQQVVLDQRAVTP